MINLKQVTKRYPSGKEALSQVDLQIERGEMVFLTGPSGAGKTTLLKIVSGLMEPDKAKIEIDGKAFSWKNGRGRIQRGLGAERRARCFL